MFNLHSLGIAKRLWIMVGCALLGILIMAGASLVAERHMLVAERESNVRQSVEVAHALIVHFYDQVGKGTLPEADAKKQALQAIKALRYNGTEYFWVNDLQPKMVMHPIKPELDGTDLSENKDPNGKHLFVEMVGVVKAGGAGFVRYMWPKPGSANPVQKVS